MAQLDLFQMLQLMQQLGITPNVSSGRKAKAKVAGPKIAKGDFSARDAAIKGAFTRKGFTDVTLVSRNADGTPDFTKPYNVKPFKAWVQDGRVVRKGQHGVKGLFHITQTDPIPVAEF